jgi:Tol biopolymer transport system component
LLSIHNNRGYRDLWALDIHSGKSKRLFKDARMGNLAIHPQNHALWGVQIRHSQSALVVSPFPYRKILPLTALPMGTILNHLQIYPNGKTMLATLRKSTGEQAIILIDLVKLLTEKKLLYTVISNEGNPEHPAWGINGKSVYWNAYTSGVSNIFRQQLGSKKVEVLSNTPTGLFHPLVLDQERIFAYQFTSQGFQPVIMKNQATQGVAAIHYRGQRVIEKHPELKKWRLESNHQMLTKTERVGEEYHGLFNLQKNRVYSNHCIKCSTNRFRGLLGNEGSTRRTSSIC